MHPCRIFLHSDDLSYVLLSKSTLYFGNNSCQCFEASVSKDVLEQKKEDFETDIKCIASEGNNYILQLIKQMPYTVDSPDISHSIFQIFPSDNTCLSFSTCKFDTVSRWALDYFLEQYCEHKAEVCTNFYLTLSPLTEAVLLQGIMFESRVMNYLDAIKDHHQIPIHQLISSGNSIEAEWFYHGPIQQFTFMKYTLTAGIADAVQMKVPVHLAPFYHNQAAVDLILYDPNDLHKITYIQITMNMSHSIAISGLQFIQRQLKYDTPLAGLHPSKAHPWCFIFVVPSSEMESTYKVQNFYGDTPLHEWASKVQQYVVCLEDQIIFRKEPNGTQCATTSQPREQQVQC